MKYVGLLSGGKDSCYNLLHCCYNGHELVAAASLGPQHGKEEIDSYLYQTVGQDAIEFVTRALEVPLHRKSISGTAVEQRSEYGGRFAEDSGGVPGDETEDLFQLLSEVKEQHPDIQGVAVGAILSNYQRVRVEHVCRRLNLTALSFLWQRDQAELMSEMIDAGVVAVIIKVAGIGLTSKHLGKSLAEMQPTLCRLSELYGSHICGEGGEYETLTLDCPLFKNRIRLSNVEAVIHSDHDFATVAYLRIRDAILETKSVNQRPLVIPPLLEDEYLEVESAVKDMSTSSVLVQQSASLEQSVTHGNLFRSVKQLDPWITLSEICGIDEFSDMDLSFEDEVQHCFQKLQDRLADHHLDLSHCSNINVFLSSMDHFSILNSVYAKFFGTSPPARACVAVDLPPPIRIKLDCIACTESDTIERKALHVQGLSYWAPANIGPYSQAIQVGEQVFISGQIGLIPSNLSLPSPPSVATEIALVFQHVDRVKRAVRETWGRWDGHTELALYWVVDPNDIPKVRRACEIYSHEVKTPTLFICIPALPKGALVEKQVMLHTGRCLFDDDGERVLQARLPEFEQGRVNDNVYYEIFTFKDSEDACAVICARDNGDIDFEKLKEISSVHQLLTSILSVRLFYLPPKRLSAFKFCNTLFCTEKYPPITSIPSRAIQTKTSDSWDYALCIIAK